MSFKKLFAAVLVVTMLPLSMFSCSNLTGNNHSTEQSTYDFSKYPPPTYDIPDEMLGDIPMPYDDYNYVFDVKYTASLVANNSVGDQWSYGVTCTDAKEIVSLYCTNSSKITLKAHATENDEYNDYGCASTTFSNLNVGETQTKTIYVSVVENRGKYTGNTAQWKFTITVKRIK